MSRENWTSEKIFDRLLTNKTQKTYWDNIRVLRSRPNTEVYNRAYELSKSSIEKEKIIGIYVLAQLGFNPRFNREKTINLYFNILNNQQSPKVLEAILSSIAHNNEALTNQQILELIKFRNHNYSDVRFHLTLALSAVEKEEAIDTLIYLTRDKHSDVRNYATWSLGSQLININSEKIINALWERTTDEDQTTKSEAIYGLARLKDSRIKEILKKELENIDNHGSQTLESIEELNDEIFIGLIEKQIEINKTTKTVNEQWLSNTLKKLKKSKDE